MIDIIIATYNRPAVICKLVEDIVSKSIPELNKIIVVDSSDNINENVKQFKQVKYTDQIKHISARLFLPLANAVLLPM